MGIITSCSHTCYTTYIKITEYEELPSVTHFRLLYADITFVPDIIQSNIQYGSSAIVLARNNWITLLRMHGSSTIVLFKRMHKRILNGAIGPNMIIELKIYLTTTGVNFRPIISMQCPPWVLLSLLWLYIVSKAFSRKADQSAKPFNGTVNW